MAQASLAGNARTTTREPYLMLKRRVNIPSFWDSSPVVSRQPRKGYRRQGNYL